MTNNPLYLHCIFADDIRQEASGKQIVVGMYQGGMNINHPLPVNLPQLYVMALLHIPHGEPLESLKVTVRWNEKTLAELEMPADSLPTASHTSPDHTGSIIQLVIELVPFLVDSSGKLQVQALINGEQTLEGNTLHVVPVAQAQDALEEKSWEG